MLVKRSDAGPVGFKQLPVFSHEHFINVGFSDIAPTRFLLKSLEQFFDWDAALCIGHKTELIRSAAQDVGKHPAQLFYFQLLTAFTQGTLPS